jgi:DNA modification methylase
MSDVDLKPDPHNANRGTPRGHGIIEQSIRRHGAGRSGLAANDGTMIAGSQTLEEMAALGIPIKTVHTTGEEWVVVVRDDIEPGSETAALMAIEDNRASELGLDWNPDVLDGLIEEGLDLSTLFREGELPITAEEVVPGAGGDDFDTTPSDGPTRTQPGDLWRIGPHRLLVGDCTDPANVARLMGGERADMVFVDPPYNLASDGELIAAQAIRDSYGALKNSDWGKNFDPRPSFDALLPALAKDVTVYVCTSQFLAGAVWKWMAEWSGFYYYVVWCKSNPMPSLAMRHWTWGTELICYATRGRHTFNFPVGEHALNWWDIPGQSHETDHPTEKPIAVPQRAIEYSSKRSAIVLDVFMGSGTTLIAAHRTGRRCYGMEISPKYADVILRRAEAEGLHCERAE